MYRHRENIHPFYMFLIYSLLFTFNVFVLISIQSYGNSLSDVPFFYSGYKENCLIVNCYTMWTISNVFFITRHIRSINCTCLLYVFQRSQQEVNFSWPCHRTQIITDMLHAIQLLYNVNNFKCIFWVLYFIEYLYSYFYKFS
jgi:hypothetical protein